MSLSHRINVPPRLGLTSADSLARELEVSPRTLRRWIQRGHLPAPCRLGRSSYWSTDDVRSALLRKQGGQI
jgi:hypothetical protein